MSQPGAIHRKIVELLRQNPEGLTSGQIRAKLNIAPEEQGQLDRRRRELRKWYVLEKRQVGNDWVYILKGEKTGIALARDVNTQVRAAVLWRAHGRCQVCGRTIIHHGVVLVVDYRFPLSWGGSRKERNPWAICQDCFALLNRCSSAWAMPQKTARQRVAVLLRTMRGQWVARTWLKAVAGTADWSRALRALREEGWEVQVRAKRGTDGERMTYYSLLHSP